MKFCKDCEYLDKHIDVCLHKKAKTAINLVTGCSTYYSAQFMRGFEDCCGKSAKLFEPKRSLYQKWFGKIEI